MKTCNHLVEVGRRQFLMGAVTATARGVASAESRAAPSHALVKYPTNRLANLTNLKVNEPFEVSYPDADAPGVLIKLGRRVADGAGPNGDIVGFSTICPHKGFSLIYSGADKTLNCPGHYSRFDCEKSGQQIWGQATQTR